MPRCRTGAAVPVVLAAALVATLSAGPARADDPKDRKRAVDAQVADLRGQVRDATDAAALAERLLEEADAKLPPARAALADARTALGAAEAHAGEVADELAATLRAADQVEWGVGVLATALARHRSAVGSIARQAYTGGNYSQLSMIMDAQSPDDFVSAMSYVRAVGRSQKATIDQLDEDKSALDAKRAELEAVRAKVAEDQAAAEEAVAAREGAARAATEAEAAVAALVAEREKALAAAEDLREEIEARYREMQAESDRLAKVIAARAAAARRAAERAKRSLHLDGVLQVPVSGPVTSSYGMRYHPILRRTKLHTGVDFGVPTGTAVHAALGGTVLESYWNTAYGNRVVVDHGIVNGVYLVTTYNHLSRSSVSSGEKLDKGEVLGRSGNTGWSTGPHLHFEVLEDGRFVDPMKWLR